MQLQQHDKPLKQQLRTIVWQNGSIRIDPSKENLPEILNDPHTLVWLDIQGECALSEDMLKNVFKLKHITIHTMSEEHERAKYTENEMYSYIVMHGLVFDTATEEAETPKLDIVFAQNYIITAHRDSLPWLDELLEEARQNDPEEHLMSRGVAFLLYSIVDALTDSYFPILDTIEILDSYRDLMSGMLDVYLTTVSNRLNEVIDKLKILDCKQFIRELREILKAN